MANTLKDANTRGHYIFVIGGLAVAVIPYLAFFLNSDLRASWILDSGHFADNLAIAIRHALVGITLGGWLWLLFRKK